MARRKEQPTEQPKQEQQPTQQPKQQQPKQEAKQQPTQPSSPKVKRITWTYFERFNPDKPNRKSWIKESIELAKKEPVMVSNLKRGQIMALINQVDRHNMNSDYKIIYKYDVKRGIVLLAPKNSYLEKLKQQGEGDKK
jgi:hypothetical protein